jgi:SAM-dependent methyltransferase
MDPEAYRADSRERWERAAPGWEARADLIRRSTEVLSRALVDRAAPGPGDIVVEIAAGTGDTGLLAAERVRPGGRVLITDGAEAMVEAARRAIAARGVPNAEARVMEAEWLDLSAATVDRVVSRWGYMLLADPAAALREARRVLRPGGRIAIAVWAPMEHNPWIGVLQRELLARGLAEKPAPGAPGMFALAAPGLAEDLLAGAGFADVGSEPVDFAWRAPSLEAWWEHVLGTSVSLGEVLAGLPPAEHYALRDALDAGYAPFVAEDGTVRLPARSLVAWGEA